LFDRTVTRRGTAEEHRELTSAAELRGVLEDTFGITLPTDAKLASVLEHLAAQAASAAT